MRKEIEEKINNLYDKYKTVELEKIEPRDNFIKIESYRVKTNNNDVFYRDKIIKNNGCGSSASILPILDNKKILLVVEPRVFTKNTVEISLPGGYIDKDEDVKDAAKRELEEETGLISNNIELVSEFYQDLGNSDHISSVFIAYDCKKTGVTKYDSDEYIGTIEVTIDEFFELIDNGTIKNSSTIISGLILKDLIKNKKVI